MLHRAISICLSIIILVCVMLSSEPPRISTDRFSLYINSIYTSVFSSVPDDMDPTLTQESEPCFLYTSGTEYTQEEISLLARLISAEARGEPYSGQVAVGAVVLNRVEHPSFPDNIYDVCYQNGAFSCVNNGQIDNEPTESCKNAAEEAISGSDPSGGAVYFYNPKTAASDWIRTRPVVKTIGNHRFCI